jgi:hypothetical protein
MQEVPYITCYFSVCTSCIPNIQRHLADGVVYKSNDCNNFKHVHSKRGGTRFAICAKLSLTETHWKFTNTSRRLILRRLIEDT